MKNLGKIKVQEVKKLLEAFDSNMLIEGEVSLESWGELYYYELKLHFLCDDVNDRVYDLGKGEQRIATIKKFLNLDDDSDENILPF
jgi:hypothetical protein